MIQMGFGRAICIRGLYAILCASDVGIWTDYAWYLILRPTLRISSAIVICGDKTTVHREMLVASSVVGGQGRAHP